MNAMSIGAAIMLAVVGGAQTLKQVKTDKDASKPEYRKVDTSNFTIEVPAGWAVSDETPWGSRDIRPSVESKVVTAASMSSMSGPGLGRQSWDRLYDTSLYFITRYDRQGKMKATPYALAKSRRGFETCSWDMTDADGKVVQRHVILKHTNGNILALSVKIPSDASAKERQQLDRMFAHMVDTAVIK